ncbi:hypothetical protein E5D57_012746 [Metarhizium anisopliae]|nr:hypothetical protein E5D57_012746 [Metarhizium anisopliae]
MPSSFNARFNHTIEHHAATHVPFSTGMPTGLALKCRRDQRALNIELGPPRTEHLEGSKMLAKTIRGKEQYCKFPHSSTLASPQFVHSKDSEEKAAKTPNTKVVSTGE